MEKQENKKKESHELNLLDLILMFFQWIKKTSIGLFHFILKTLRFGFQYFWIITLCAFIALVVGFFCTKPSQVKVEGRSTLLFAPENRANVYNNLKVIQAYCGDLKVLPQLLNIEDSVAKKIREINIYNLCYSKDKYKNYHSNTQHYYGYINKYDDNTYDHIVGEPDVKNKMSQMGDTTNLIMSDRLMVGIKAKNLAGYNDVYNKIAQYLVAQPTINAIHQAFVEQTENRIKFCDNEIKRLDSLANHTYFNSPTDFSLKMNNTVLTGEVKKQLLYEEINQLYNWRQNLSYNLERYKSPAYFTSDVILMRSSRLIALFLWILGGIAFGYAVALYVRYKKEIAAYMKKK